MYYFILGCFRNFILILNFFIVRFVIFRFEYYLFFGGWDVECERLNSNWGGILCDSILIVENYGCIVNLLFVFYF